MRNSTSIKVMAVLLGTALTQQLPAFAQEATVDVAAEPASDESGTATLYAAADLDALLAPVALYPDALLAQVLLATTYPVDVLLADRFLSKNAALDDKARSALAADLARSGQGTDRRLSRADLAHGRAYGLDRTDRRRGLRPD